VGPELRHGNGASARSTGLGGVEVLEAGGEDGAGLLGYQILHLSPEGGLHTTPCSGYATRILRPFSGAFVEGISLAAGG